MANPMEYCTVIWVIHGALSVNIQPHLTLQLGTLCIVCQFWSETLAGHMVHYPVHYWFTLECVAHDFNYVTTPINGNVLWDWLVYCLSSHCLFHNTQCRMCITCNKRVWPLHSFVTTHVFWTSYLLTAVWALYGNVKHWIDPWALQVYKW